MPLNTPFVVGDPYGYMGRGRVGSLKTRAIICSELMQKEKDPIYKEALELTMEIIAASPEVPEIFGTT